MSITIDILLTIQQASGHLTVAWRPALRSTAAKIDIRAPSEPRATGANEDTCSDALMALSQRTRMRIFKALAAAGPSGIPLEALAMQEFVHRNSLSSHLYVLARAKLVSRIGPGSSTHYAANLATMASLWVFLGCEQPQSIEPNLSTRSRASADDRRALGTRNAKVHGVGVRV